MNSNQNKDKGSVLNQYNEPKNDKANANSNNSIASILRQKLNKNQKIDISQIKQYYDIQSHNVSYQYAPSNPIGPKQLNNQAQKPGYNESNSFSSPVQSELQETPQVMRKSKRVAFNESQIGQIIPIDQQQINYLKRNFIEDNSNSSQKQGQEGEQNNEFNQNIKIINQEFERSQRILEDNPIQVEEISQSVTPVKINRNLNKFSDSVNKENNDCNSIKSGIFSNRKSGATMRLSTNQSLCDEQILEEIRNWEKMFDVDKAVLGKVETTFKQMEDRITDLEAQFEICYNLTGKMEQKYQDLHKLLKGTPVFKVSRANKKKANLRIFFYSPSLEAFCWKSTKDNFPEKKQLVFIKNIREVQTKLEAGRKLPSPFTEQQFIRIVMMDKKQQDLELICEDTQLRTILLKSISSLIEDLRKSQHVRLNQESQAAPSLISNGANCEFLINKYANDIQGIKEQINNTKSFFGDSTQLLRNAFFQATQNLVQKERKKRKQIMQKQKQEFLLKKKEEEEQAKLMKQKVSQIIKIEKEDYDNIAYQNIELKQEISDLEYEKQCFNQRLDEQNQCIQLLINSINESINKLCQAPAVQDIQQFFYQYDTASQQAYLQHNQQLCNTHSNNNLNTFQNQYYQDSEQQSEYKYGEVIIQQNQIESIQQCLVQSNQLKQILNSCIDKILSEYFNLVESQSNRHTAASDKLSQPKQSEYQISIKKAIQDKEEEIKRIKSNNQDLSNRFSFLQHECNKLQIELKNFTQNQEDLQRTNRYYEMENVEIKQENEQLREQIENLLCEIKSKEDNFSCIVEGLQLMRDEILNQVDILQEEISNQQNHISQLQKSNQPSSLLKISYLENKIKEKDLQIKQLIGQIDDQQIQSQNNSKTNLENSQNESNLISLKVKNQQLTQELSTLKCNMQFLANKNQYLEKLVLQLQSQPSLNLNQNSTQANKENQHPNFQSSEYSFKVRHDRTPSQNSLQFQSKQFNLINQRNVELQQQLQATSNLVKELEQKIVKRESYRPSNKTEGDELQSYILSHQSQQSLASNNHYNQNQLSDFGSQNKFFHHQKQQSLKQFPIKELLNYTVSPSNRLNNKF
ncbi:hypothetical protein ABPG72_018269 [Tetrahymena utriculariae]